MKKLLITFLLILTAFPVFAEVKKATLINPETFEKKVVDVGCRSCFDGGWVLYSEQEEMLGVSTQPAALATYNLAGSGVNSSATSITLQSLTLPQNDYKILDSNLSDTFYITLEPGSRVRQEIVGCTTVTQNAGGTATLSGCTRGLSPVYPYTASSSLKFSHAGGSQVIFSDPPQLFSLYPAKANDETITGKYTFNLYPENGTGLNATTSNQFITLSQANSIGNQGAATATPENAGIVEEATRAEISAGTAFDANSPHYISSEYATSTCDTATSSVVVTASDGKITWSCIDQTEAVSLSATTTLSGDVVIGATQLTSSAAELNKLDGASANVTATNLNDLTDSGTTTLHSHDIAIGTIATSSVEATVSSVTVTHGLGYVPNLITINAVASAHSNADGGIWSIGYSDGTNQHSVYAAEEGSGSPDVKTDMSTSVTGRIDSSQTAGETGVTITVTNITSTTFKLTLTDNDGSGNETETIDIVWKAE